MIIFNDDWKRLILCNILNSIYSDTDRLGFLPCVQIFCKGNTMALLNKLTFGWHRNNVSHSNSNLKLSLSKFLFLSIFVLLYIFFALLYREKSPILDRRLDWTVA